MNNDTNQDESSQILHIHKKFSIKYIIKRATLIIIISFIIFVILFTIIVFFNQRKLIYYPRKYDASYIARLPKNIIKIPYSTIDGRQMAFYVPLSENPNKPPASLWVLFGGNAMRALDWLDVIEKFPKADIGFLLIEYPGYGECEGSPTEKGIAISSEDAFTACANYFKIEKNMLENNINVLSFSIGSGPGLRFAVNHPVKRVILAAPFTSLSDMAETGIPFGCILKYLLIEKYDNRDRLTELANRSTPPVIDIFHGEADNIIPFRMGKELADSYPKMITFHQIKGSDHNWLLEIITGQLKDSIVGERL